MSYESLRFSWQKLLINQVPQKGGGGGVYVDYNSQWQQAQNAFNKAAKIVPEIQSSFSRIAADPAAAPAIVAANNQKANTAIAELDAIINQTSAIPEYVFSGSEVQKPDALRILNETRSNIARCITELPPPPPPQPQPALPTIRIPAEVIPQQPVILSGNGTWVPDGPVAGVGSYVPGKVVTGVAAIVFAEDGNQYSSPAAVPAGLRYSYSRWRWQPSNVPPPPPPPPPKPKSEYDIISQELRKQTAKLQKINRLMNKPIDPAPPEEIYPSSSWQYEFWSKGYSLHEVSYAESEAAKRNLLTTTNGDFALFKVKVEDLLQDAILAKQIPPAISQEIIPLPRCGVGSDGRPVLIPDLPITGQPYQPGMPGDLRIELSPIPLPVCELPTPYIDPITQKPYDPKKIPPAIRRRRAFQSQGEVNRPISLPDLPDVPTVSPSVMPRKDNWEDCLIGAGASVAELDTVRRTMAQSKLDPNADICAVAKTMLTAVRNPRATGLGFNPNAVNSNGSIFGQNPINQIPGVFRCGVSTVNMIKANTIAQKRAQQTRRGILNNRK